ncbi:MAG: metal ABC transporter permease [Planctomycetes bacterium]|nr:metal ABC transporter permease [Planctomycetota bacterium]
MCVRAMVGLIAVGIACGLVGCLVVGSRMAFFSDALAHCAFAGVSLGFLLFELIKLRMGLADEQFWWWVTPLMVVFGAGVGMGVSFVRQRTSLGNDAVIGVFFAGSLGLAATLSQAISSRKIFSLEEFLFGDPLLIQSGQIILLTAVLAITALFMGLGFNGLVLGSFNTSLARSRAISIDWLQTGFIVLLAVVINVCLRVVGVLLINALLIVPAAIAMNLSSNLRQMFWITLATSVGLSVTGQIVSWEVQVRYDVPVGIAGTIVTLAVLAFILTMPLARRGRRVG